MVSPAVSKQTAPIAPEQYQHGHMFEGMHRTSMLVEKFEDPALVAKKSKVLVEWPFAAKFRSGSVNGRRRYSSIRVYPSLLGCAVAIKGPHNAWIQWRLL
jgi:hypothetical protein